MQVTGYILELEPTVSSQNGNWYTKGVIESLDKELYSFCIFWKSFEAIEPLNKSTCYDFLGRKDRKDGTFIVNYFRDRDSKIIKKQIESVDRSDKTYRGNDAINGKRPIEYVMEVLGAEYIATRLRLEFFGWSDVIASKENLNRYKNLLEAWIKEAKDYEKRQSF